MPLTAGLRLGPYEILSLAGSGGMGEVYRARDTKLGRDIAIKILPEAFASDPDRLARFEREARTLASLNHPNIAQVYGFEERALVMELLEGETLRQRLETDAVPPRKAVELAIQMANGLAAAHEKGIVHRDLKPENVFITHDGRVKILDFGLAAQTSPRSGEGDSPTIAAGTEPGTVLGTVGYMSPEQVRGARVDHRTDIFALGAVLFEMLTGRRAFLGETPAETMTAILREDVPELSSTSRHIPLPLDRIVRRCLEKNTGERLQAARDVAIALEAVSGSDLSGFPDAAPATAAATGRWRRAAAGIAVLLVGTALGFLAATARAPTTVSAELPRFRQLTFRSGEVRVARFAPDGQSIVYSAVWDGAPQRVYPVRVDRPRGDAPSIADAALLAVSHTGDVAIATHPRRLDQFLETGTLAQIPLSGGAPRELLEDVVSADFAPDGRIAVVRSDKGRTRLEFPMGTVLYETSGWLSSPRVSPDASRVGFHEHPLYGDDRGWPAVVEVATKVKRNVLPEQDSLSGLAWAPDGKSVCFASATTIRCAGIEQTKAARVVVRGSQRFILEDIARDGRMLAIVYGTHGAMVAGEVGGREVDLSWQDLSLPIDFTADGTRLLFESLDYGVNIRGLDGGSPIRLADGIPAGLSPDGRSVLAIVPELPTTIAVVPTGPGTPRMLQRGPIEAHSWGAWMPDGSRVVLSATEHDRGTRLYLQDTAGGQPQPFSPEGARLMAYLPRVVSPDGRIVIAVGPDQRAALYPVAGGAPQPIAALGDDLVPIGWGETADVLLARGRTLARQTPIFKVDLKTGRRELLKEVGPVDPKGAPLVWLVQVSRDGRRYAYAMSQALGAAFLIEGLKP